MTHYAVNYMQMQWNAYNSAFLYSLAYKKRNSPYFRAVLLYLLTQQLNSYNAFHFLPIVPVGSLALPLHP
jgi:hypothetical protein